MDPMQQQAYAQMLTQMGPTQSTYQPANFGAGLNPLIQALMQRRMMQKQQAQQQPPVAPPQPPAGNNMQPQSQTPGVPDGGNQIANTP